MIPQNLPDDINVELLFNYYPKGSCKASFMGLHHRNSYSDVIGIEQEDDDVLHVDIGRNGLYNSLPEYMFHPMDRFNELPKLEEKELFKAEYEKQEQEKRHARQFFAPIDAALFRLRLKVRECLQDYYETDKVIMDILCDEMTSEQKENRFIRRLLPFLPYCKFIRGNKTLLTMMMRKVFIEEWLKIEVCQKGIVTTDDTPRYHCTLGSSLDSCYLGNVFDERTTVYDIHYWSDDDCDDQFMSFVGEVEQLRCFIQDYFMSIDEVLTFNICNDGAPLRLNDEVIYNYLNFNTNI